MSTILYQSTRPRDLEQSALQVQSTWRRAYSTLVYQSREVSVADSTQILEVWNNKGSGYDVVLTELFVTFIDYDVGARVRLDLFRTSAESTAGGTSASFESATRDVGGGNLTRLNLDTPDHLWLGQQTGLTIKELPTTGPTRSQWLMPVYVEDDPSNALLQRMFAVRPSVVVPEESGFLLVNDTANDPGSSVKVTAYLLIKRNR